MRTLVATLLALTLCACVTLPPEPAPPRLGYTDLTGDFGAIYDTAPADPAARLAAINAGMGERLPGFYDPARMGDQADAYVAFAGRFLANYPGQKAAIADVARRFGTMFAPAVADFERRIGPLPTTTPVALVVSMGEFDGATRTLGGREYLLFGADMIATLHKGEARAFVQHELFHIYHSQRMSECTGLYCSLWQEGLAVHAAQQLNPSASDSELLLTMPEPVRPALEANRREAVCTTLAKLDSTDGGDWGAYFSNGRLNDRLPPRFGYLVGAWVAADLGRTRSLPELAALDGKPLRAAIEASLRSMARCD